MQEYFILFQSFIIYKPKGFISRAECVYHEFPVRYFSQHYNLHKATNWSWNFNTHPRKHTQIYKSGTIASISKAHHTRSDIFHAKTANVSQSPVWNVEVLISGCGRRLSVWPQSISRRANSVSPVSVNGPADWAPPVGKLATDCEQGPRTWPADWTGRAHIRPPPHTTTSDTTGRVPWNPVRSPKRITQTTSTERRADHPGYVHWSQVGQSS